MKLVFSFVQPGRPSRTFGPFAAVRLDGDTVRAAEDRALIARHREHQWEVEGERYFRLDCPSRVSIHFERPVQALHSRGFGPFERFSAVDGIAYTDDRVFAFVDPKVGDWFCYNDGQHWPVMVVSDAGEGTPRSRLRSLAALAPLLGGVLGLWKRGGLLYLGRAYSLREGLLALANGSSGVELRKITAITWEMHPRPAMREAELLAVLTYTSLCSSA